MRVTSDLFVSALLRRVNGAGSFAALGRKGALEAGAIFVKLRRKDGLYDLFAPAPQTAYDADHQLGRVFQSVEAGVPESDVEARLAKERNWDPDLWIVEIEDYHQPIETLFNVAVP